MRKRIWAAAVRSRIKIQVARRIRTLSETGERGTYTMAKRRI